ncbi:MAG: hypothetical protein JSV91_03630 [Phycisphaerales bacterium]|nr:MAG: hypothetical protein JSV91_03630 [Phycisphaerales bacterium]
MKRLLTRKRVKDFLTAAGFSLVATATMPLLAILIFTIRPVAVLIAGVAFLVSCLSAFRSTPG